ncbi:hypothetical protein FB451DRAFT_1255617 [Mycena latifolia]|nr:hypothetical protein FB451DRAFT_1255617 [Mycena latifolia]
MSGIARLSLDVLRDIMLSASSIEGKFALAQVSRLWQDLALDTPLLWSSFTAATYQSRLRSCPPHVAAQRLNHRAAYLLPLGQQ